VLLFEQRADEVNVDRRFGGRRLHVRHGSSVHFRRRGAAATRVRRKNGRFWYSATG
jgi:hypothetical protein